MRRSYPPALQRFFDVGRFAVVGASRDREKYGNKVLRCYAQHGLPVIGVNPKLDEAEGVPCVGSLALAVADGPRAASVVAPPTAATRIVDDAIAAGVQHLVWSTLPDCAALTGSARIRAAGSPRWRLPQWRRQRPWRPL